MLQNDKFEDAQLSLYGWLKPNQGRNIYKILNAFAAILEKANLIIPTRRQYIQIGLHINYTERKVIMPRNPRQIPKNKLSRQMGENIWGRENCPTIQGRMVQVSMVQKGQKKK